MLKRITVITFLFAALILSQTVKVQSTTDLVGNGTALQLSSTATTARWVQLVAPTGNAAVVRWGDNTISATRGAVIAAGGGQYLAPYVQTPGGTVPTMYDLSNIYYLAQSGDKLTITWGQ